MKWVNYNERLPDENQSVIIKGIDYNNRTLVNMWTKEEIVKYHDMYFTSLSQVRWLDESEEPVFTKDEVLALVKDILNQQKKDLNSKLSSLYKDIKFKWKDH